MKNAEGNGGRFKEVKVRFDQQAHCVACQMSIKGKALQDAEGKLYHESRDCVREQPPVLPRTEARRSPVAVLPMSRLREVRNWRPGLTPVCGLAGVAGSRLI